MHLRNSWGVLEAQSWDARPAGALGHCWIRAVERLPLGLWVGVPADEHGGAPGARHSVPRAQPERCFPALLQLAQTIQLQPLLALTAQ